MVQLISSRKDISLSLIFVLVSLDAWANAQSGCDDGWISYKDEKCIHIMDNFVDAEDATATCDSLAGSLLSIKTEEEQLFLTQQLYEISGVVDNVWLAVKRYNASDFIWTEDNSSVIYTNWGPSFPTDDTENDCVQMISHFSTKGNKLAEEDGLWEDVSCLKRNLVVCQKLQTLSAVELQRIVLDNRRRVEENEKKLQEMENNPVPLGFIYVQLAGQPEPNEIWTNVQFSDVTSEYAGQFFRALGGDSSGFGETQNFRSPVLAGEWSENPEGAPISINVPFGSWSPYLFSGAYEGGAIYQYYGLRFNFDNSEVRPYNSAVKIWKRTA